MPRGLNTRGVSSETSENLKWEERKLKLQLDHELTMKRLELDQKRGLEHLGVSRETANLLTVGGTCVVIVSSGAWLVSHLLTDTRASLVSVQRELFSQSGHMRSFISGTHYPKQSPEKTPSEQTASSKKMMCV